MRFLILSIVFTITSAGVAAQEKEKKVEMDEATKKATAKALAWLKNRQNPDGSFSDGAYAHNTAITAYAMLAFMSQGHLPGQGTYGPEVAKAGRFLVAAQREIDGYLVGARGGNMYCHAMATLALAELYGQTGDDALKPVVKKATDLIVRSQAPNGGWRYEPHPTGADISVTIMQVMALRAAKNSGLHVPDTTMKKALAYINSCYRPQAGGFAYMPGSTPGFARTAAGVCVLYLAGEYNDDRLKKMRDEKKPNPVDYLHRHFESPIHFYYGHYYAAHAMHQVGGKDWEEWYGRLVKYFVASGIQQQDGSWSTTRHREVGPVYQTSIAVIILSVPAHYLPIFQR
ncbi:MAG: terpene cyclase/mutase family protein [Planctomycetes bacterium]|nr:terpene cyclase/mutase family protein [Planctomycetota bacterium]